MAKPLDWQKLLVDGYEPLRVAQRVFRRLPRGPRCKLCQNPFAGIGGRLVGLMGRRPSRKNPNLCQACFDHLPEGGIEIDVGIVFADIRASTKLGEQSTATEFAMRLNRFYAAAADVLIRNDGLVDKLIGDEVMGCFSGGWPDRTIAAKLRLPRWTSRPQSTTCPSASPPTRASPS